jgi:hypothetical protein
MEILVVFERGVIHAHTLLDGNSGLQKTQPICPVRAQNEQRYGIAYRPESLDDALTLTLW